MDVKKNRMVTAGVNRGLTIGRVAASGVLPALVFVATAHAGDFGGFAEPYSIENLPTSGLGQFAAGDLDGDGDNDFLWIGDGSTSGRVGINDGTGKFSVLSTWQGYETVSEVILSDVNADGNLDAVVARSSATGPGLIVGFNDGNSDFNESILSAAPYFYDVVSVDMDGDGDADLVTIRDPDGSAARAIEVWINDGDGGFTSTEPVGLGLLSSSAQWLGVGDVDGDGDIDVAVNSVDGNGNRVIVIFSNDGDGTLSLYNSGITVSTGVSVVTQLSLHDLNGDAYGDISTLRFSNAQGWSLRVALNNGDGTFASFVPYAFTEEAGYPRDLFLGDLTGDGIPDITVVGDGNAGITSFINEGDGTFAPAVFTDDGYADASENGRDLAVVDVDGNGSPDAMVANTHGGVHAIAVYINQTAVTPPPAFDLLAPKNGVVALSPLTPMLLWGDSVGFQVSSTVTIATDPAMQDVIHEAIDLTGTSYDVPDGVLEAGMQYYWTVTASNPQGDTPAANGPFTFTTLITGDLNMDGIVNVTDLLLLLANWGGA